MTIFIKYPFILWCCWDLLSPSTHSASQFIVHSRPVIWFYCLLLFISCLSVPVWVSVLWMKIPFILAMAPLQRAFYCYWIIWQSLLVPPRPCPFLCPSSHISSLPSAYLWLWRRSDWACSKRVTSHFDVTSDFPAVHTGPDSAALLPGSDTLCFPPLVSWSSHLCSCKEVWAFSQICCQQCCSGLQLLPASYEVR